MCVCVIFANVLNFQSCADGEKVSVGVCAAGLMIFKDRIRLHRFVWAKIVMISYKRNNFIIKIRPNPGEVRFILTVSKMKVKIFFKTYLNAGTSGSFRAGVQHREWVDSPLLKIIFGILRMALNFQVGFPAFVA